MKAKGKIKNKRNSNKLIYRCGGFSFQDNYEWQENAARLRFNVRFGFGLMDAEAMVRAAINWTKVPQKSICTVQAANG